MALHSDKRANSIFLSLGTNLGDRFGNMKRTCMEVGKHIGPVVKASSIYESESWGNADLPNFLNQVILVQSNLEPMEVLEKIKQIEEGMGRLRKKNGVYESRTIDIDILYFNEMVMENETLRLPHPYLHLRNFVLQPLNEIAPEFIHPILKVENRKLLSMSEDKLWCNKTF